MRRIALAGWVLVLLAGFFACATRTVRPGVEYKDSYRSYLRVLKNWTREAERFEGVDTDAIVSATFWSEDLTRAYAAERARAESLPEDRANALLDQLLDRHARQNRFRVTLFTVERDWNDLDKNPSSWKVYLLAADGSLVEPVSIKRRKTDPESDRLYFPQSDRWSRTYDLVFPKTGLDDSPLLSETSGRFGLLITGVRARAELGWVID